MDNNSITTIIVAIIFLLAVLVVMFVRTPQQRQRVKVTMLGLFGVERNNDAPSINTIRRNKAGKDLKVHADSVSDVSENESEENMTIDLGSDESKKSK